MQQRIFFRMGRACVAAAWVLTVVSTAEACKYTVRDVAFVTLREAPYRLDVSLETGANDELVSRAQAAADLALTDANIAVHCEAGDQTALTLTAPDDRRLAIPFNATDGDLVDTLRTTCRQLTGSPAQLELRRLLLAGHHSVIVLHEGDNEAYNQQARETVAGLIAEVKRALPSLPKPIDLPPELLVVSQEQTPDENVFLWSLGIEPEQFAEGQLVILFGRCRLLGPPMPVPGTNRQQILRRLAAVGQDCECELDRSVMRGQMVLHEWTAREESIAATMLGFDPGNPLVQVEIQRILSRGPSSGRPPAESIDLAVDDLNLGGLQIIDIGAFGEEDATDSAPVAEGTAAEATRGDATPADAATTPVASPDASRAESPLPVGPPATEAIPPTPGGPGRPLGSALFWLVGVVAAVGIAGAAWILARGGK